MIETSLAKQADILMNDREFVFRARRADGLHHRIREMQWSGDPLRYRDDRQQLEELHRAFEEALRDLGLAALAVMQAASTSPVATPLAEDPVELDLQAIDETAAPEEEPTEPPPPSPAPAPEPTEADGPDDPLAGAPDAAGANGVVHPMAVPATAPPDTARPAALSSSILEQLQQRLRGSALPDAVPPPRAVPVEAITELKARVGSMRQAFSDQNAIDSERGLLRALTQPEQTAQWVKFPPHLQVALVELLAARARTLQHEANLHECPILREVFSSLSAHCRDHEPGFAYGLARNHHPRIGGAWRDDAIERQRRFHELVSELVTQPELPISNGEAQRAVESLLEEGLEGEALQEELIALVRRGLRPDTRISRLLAEYTPLLDAPELKSLRKAVRDQQRDDAETAEGDEEAPLTTVWPYQHLTQDKVAVLVGGDPREDVRERLERRFGFASLDWIPGNKGARRIQALAEKVDGGTVDLVFVLVDFVRHSVTERLRTDSPNAMVIHVPSGYGVTRLRRGVEQAAQRRD